MLTTNKDLNNILRGTNLEHFKRFIIKGISPSETYNYFNGIGYRISDEMVMITGDFGTHFLCYVDQLKDNTKLY